MEIQDVGLAITYLNNLRKRYYCIIYYFQLKGDKGFRKAERD